MQEVLNNDLQTKIFTIRGLQVIVDRDLADLYKVEVKRLNEQVKRNTKRFPKNFRFQLNNLEKNELVAICDRFENWKHSSNNPFVFTEQGVAMLSAVLKSEIAVHTSIQIINAFVEMRKMLNLNSGLIQRIEGVERKLIESDQKFENLFSALEKNNVPTQGVFFDGQVFDAYELMSKIIRSATKEIILIDIYIDETVLAHLSKRAESVEAIIYTKSISRVLQLDLERHNSQYPLIQIRELRESHDRFLIIDRKELYHIGASLKDLGKKWFAFSKLDEVMLDFVLNRLNES
ncbi:MAG: hypothetical protein RL264_636 [Bacteroidota bacterium]|jgi:hypothetical protein